MSFPRYPAYKDSGVEWLGEVPEHWEVKPLKRVAAIQTGLAKGKEVEPEHCVEVPFLRVANVQDGFLNLEQIHTILIPEQSLDRYLLRHGDVLMNEGGDFDKLGRGAIWNGEIELCIHQNHVFAVRPHSVRPSWLNAYTSSKQANSYFISRSKQSTNLASISSSNLMELLVPVAPDDETTQILDFLDRETAKIDALIAEQQRLIELLQEKRQAVISHAVTKGLNPDVPMKDSGVEWLGEVPEHWEVVPIGMICSRITYGFTNPMPTCESGPFMLTANDVGMGAIDYENCRRTSVDAFKTVLSDKSRPEAGDILLTKDGTLGRVALFEGGGEAACINQSVASIRLLPDKMVPGFAAVALQSSCYQEKMLFDAGGTTIKHIYVSRLSKMPIAFPGQDEQRVILQMIGAKIDEWLILIEQSRKFLALLQERRSALISAAVTGQIDVRGLVPEASAA
jgi:type I restriction enzyme S subunit